MPGAEDPIRADLFSPERLEEHAERIARQRVLADGKPGRRLSPPIRDSARALLQCYREIAAVIGDSESLTG